MGTPKNRELAAKLATVEQVHAEREDAQRAHVAETEALINEWDSNRERVARYAADIVPLAHSRTDARPLKTGAMRP